MYLMGRNCVLGLPNNVAAGLFLIAGFSGFEFLRWR